MAGGAATFGKCSITSLMLDAAAINANHAMVSTSQSLNRPLAMEIPMMRSLRGLLFALFLAGFASPVMAQGTLPIALQQTVNINGTPLAGALLYTYVVGTVATPQTTYQDSGLSIANPWPLQADQTGRIPMFYMAAGATHARLTDGTGIVIFDYPSMLIIGAAGGSSGGGTVDPTSLISTGDLKVKYGTGTLSGYVRANGLTIGSAVSGATERANNDTQNLFVYLYGADPNLTVSGGRTGNALNDFNANKTITLPDWRGRALAALDDMGNSAAGRLTAAYFGTSATVLGASGGSQSQTLTQAQLPAVSPTFTSSTPGFNYIASLTTSSVQSGGASPFSYVNGGNTASAPLISGTISALGSGAAHPIVMPVMLATVYLKL